MSREHTQIWQIDPGYMVFWGLCIATFIFALPYSSIYILDWAGRPIFSAVIVSMLSLLIVAFCYTTAQIPITVTVTPEGLSLRLPLRRIRLSRSMIADVSVDERLRWRGLQKVIDRWVYVRTLSGACYSMEERFYRGDATRLGDALLEWWRQRDDV